MDRSRRIVGGVVVLVVLAVTLVVILGTTGSAAGGGRSTVSGDGTGPALIGTATPAGVASSAAGVTPSIRCCTGGSRPGLTAIGQATYEMQSVAARDRAITQAVADATDQAQTAADAAGITLGRILEIQVSAQPTVYPLPVASGTGTTGPTPEPVPYPSYVSVTITWAIR